MPIPNVLRAHVEYSMAEAEFLDALGEAGFIYHEKWWPDPYDGSCEFTGIDNDFRLSAEQQRIMCEAGFRTCYLNHLDKWETHYTWEDRKNFRSVCGWRKRQTNKVDGSISTLEMSYLPKSWGKMPAGSVIVPDPIPCEFKKPDSETK